MATKRLPVGLKRVNWRNGQRVVQSDVVADQTRHLGIDAANIANFLGSGVVKNSRETSIILDTNDLNSQQQTLLDGYSFDGQNVYIGSPLTNVNDTIKGVQLSVSVSNTSLAGAEAAKISIFGDTFGGDLIHDDLVFDENTTKITRGRYTNIRGILFQNFFGNLHGSRSPAKDGYDVVGRCVIREAQAMECSPDPVIASQTAQPNIFFNDFIPASQTETINTVLQDTIGADKSLADLNIGLSSFAKRELAPNDVSTKIGQKFLLKGTNIQKISVLLSVKEDTTAMDAYNWSGSIALTLHALQTEVDCPTDPVPDNTVDFDPDPTILGQITLSASDMEKQGIDLDGYARKVDFIFTGTSLSNPSNTILEKDRYYVLTISRSGDASVGTIQVEEAPHRAENGYMTIFNGIEWVNVRTSDLWFSVEGDYLKFSDGIGYKDGVGAEIPKIQKDSTNTEVPYVEGLIPFITVTRNAYNYALLEIENQFTDAVQDEATGDPVFSRVKPSPEISAITQSSLDSLISTDPAPVLLCRAQDQNPRGNPSTITGSTEYIGLVRDDIINVLNPDADLRQNNLDYSLIFPNSAKTLKYRIIETTLITDNYGDVNGDGVIDSTDLALANSLDGYWIDSPTTQALIRDGYIDILEFLRADVNGDGYVNSTDTSAISDFIDGYISTFPAGTSFTHLKIQVENVLDPLTTTADMDDADSAFKTVPFSEIDWSITYCASWLADRIELEDLRRFMPTTFTERSDDLPGGRNDFYVPGNLIIDGYQVNIDNSFYSVDFEVNHISLNFPLVDLDGYDGILLFDNLVAESSDGKTATGLTAMKYADGTYVQLGDFADGKVKITAALQSIANEFSSTATSIMDFDLNELDPDTTTGTETSLSLDFEPLEDDALNMYRNGLLMRQVTTLSDDYQEYTLSGTTVNFLASNTAGDWITAKYSTTTANIIGTTEDIVGLNYDPTTSLLTVFVNDVYDDGYGNTLPPKSFKVLVTVYLKKSGFRNTSYQTTKVQTLNLLDL